jgi:Uma2 family endonuclease
MYQTNPTRLPPETGLSDQPVAELAATGPHPLPPGETLPTMYDLPSENPEDSGLPDEFHLAQPRLLDCTCIPPHYSSEQLLTGSDLNLYYDLVHPLWYKRPDWFLVLGRSRAQQQQNLRLSYVIWQEGIAPFLVVELLSPGTEAEDLGQTLRAVDRPPTKWQVYEQILRVPYYVIFDRDQQQLRVFQLVGMRYQEITLPEPRFWFADLELGLGVWSGVYQSTEGLWLRWYEAQGSWLPLPEERAEQEYQRAEQERQRAERQSQRAEQERQRAEQQSQRAEKLAARLRELGIDPDAG